MSGLSGGSACRLDTPLKFAIAIYLFSAFFLLYLKPPQLFTAGARPRGFGRGRGETLTPYWLLIFAAGLAGFYWAREYGGFSLD